MTGSGRTTARSRVRSSSNADADADSLRDRRPKFNRHRDRSRYGSSVPLFNNVNIKVVLAISFFAFFIIWFLIRHLVNFVPEPHQPRAVTPKIMDLPQFQGQHKESLYWGTYRPHLYFGVRARTPQSLMAGLMWTVVKDGKYHLRHVCKQEDNLSAYGWKKHNGRDFGHQVLVDNGMTLVTRFFKSKGDASGYGGDWAVRIDVQIDRSKWNETHASGAQLFFYLADEGGNALHLSKQKLNIHEDSLLASGSRTDIGDWQLHLKSTDDLELHYSGFQTPHFHNLSDLVEENLASQIRKHARLQLPDSSDDSPNVLVFQITGGFSFSADIILVSGTDLESSRVEERVSSLTGTSLSLQLKYKEQEFDEKFEKFFNLAEKVDSESISVGNTVGNAAVGNLLGGIGYFYGQSKIALSSIVNLTEHVSYISYWPAELYSAVPSQSTFPRGFLWDEGFHQLVIWRWDIHISLDIIGHWLDLMNIDGWIPREQILGAEAQSRIPEEYIPQHPTVANPPTLFLALSDIINDLKNNEFTVMDRSEILLFLECAFVRLEAWFQWFNTTQTGKQMSSYYWRGRDNRTIFQLNPQTLSSGFDDYPRASHPNEDERHLDFRCWMLVAADCMNSIEELLNKETKPGKNYGSTAKLLSDHELLNQLHFDDAYGAYFDFGNHTEKVQLKWKEIQTGHNLVTRQLVREVLEKPVLSFVPHFGYVSLFPFMGRLIPSGSWILEKQLELISNRSLLWTDYGLRSLAKTSSLYMKYNTEHEAPYWRGTIWINMNYRILAALHYYSKEDGPYQDKAKAIYKELRSNLIRNIVLNYEETGFLWEQYDQVKGNGKGAHPFTGWTSLVVLIMAEAYNTI